MSVLTLALISVSATMAKSAALVLLKKNTFLFDYKMNLVCRYLVKNMPEVHKIFESTI